MWFVERMDIIQPVPQKGVALEMVKVLTQGECKEWDRAIVRSLHLSLRGSQCSDIGLAYYHAVYVMLI